MKNKNEKKTTITRNQKIFLSLFSVVIILIVLESSIRFIDLLTGQGFFSQHRNKLTSSNSTIPFRTFGFPLYQAVAGQKVISSRHGELFPIEKPKNTVRIVTFGGSTTENIMAIKEANIHYPLLLQDRLQNKYPNLNIEVINVGNSAYSTNHSLILLMLDVLSWDPDIVIMSHNINDLTASYWNDFTFDLSHKYSHDFFSSPGSDKQPTLSNTLFQHSNLYWIIKSRLTSLDQRKPIVRESQGDAPLEAAENVFRRNLNSFIALANHNGISAVLGSQALLDTEEAFNTHIGFKPYNDIVLYPLHSEFIEHHRRYNEILDEVANSENILFVDNSELNNQDEFFFDLVHYTPKGIEALADSYANTLVDSNIITKIIRE